MITVVSRPDNVSPAYLPEEYVFTSDKSPNTNPDEISGINQLKVTEDGLNTMLLLSNPVENTVKGDWVKITTTGNSDYDNQIFQVKLRIDSTLYLLDAPPPRLNNQFIIINTGTAAKFYNNYSLTADIYIAGNFIIRKHSQHNLANQFIVDVAETLKRFLTSDLLAIGVPAPTQATLFAREFYIIYGEKYDIPDGDGVMTNTLFIQISDIANTFLSANSVVPYVFLKGGEIQSTNYDLSDYIILPGIPGQFLTNMPDTVKIGRNDSVQLSILSEFVAAPILANRRIITYDNTGAVIATTNTPFAPFGLQGWHIPCGTDNLGAIITADTVRYDVLVINVFTGNSITNTITFEIDDKCHKNEVRFHWLNPLGGIDSFTFIGIKLQRRRTNKTLYKRRLNNPRVIPERQTTTVTTQPEKPFTANTGFIDRLTMEWIQELLDDVETYIQIDNEYLPVRILSAAVPVDDTRNALINMTIQYEFSFDEKRQRN